MIIILEIELNKIFQTLTYKDLIIRNLKAYVNSKAWGHGLMLTDLKN